MRRGLIVALALLLAGCALNPKDVVTPQYHWHLVDDAASYQVSTIWWFATKQCQVRVIFDNSTLTILADASYCQEP